MSSTMFIFTGPWIKRWRPCNCKSARCKSLYLNPRFRGLEVGREKHLRASDELYGLKDMRNGWPPQKKSTRKKAPLSQ